MIIDILKVREIRRFSFMRISSWLLFIMGRDTKIAGEPRVSAKLGEELTRSTCSPPPPAVRASLSYIIFFINIRHRECAVFDNRAYT